MIVLRRRWGKLYKEWYLLIVQICWSLIRKNPRWWSHPHTYLNQTHLHLITQVQINSFHALFNFSHEFFFFPNFNLTEEDRQYLLHSRAPNAYDAVAVWALAWHAAVEELIEESDDLNATCASITSNHARDSEILTKKMLEILGENVYCGVSVSLTMQCYTHYYSVWCVWLLYGYTRLLCSCQVWSHCINCDSVFLLCYIIKVYCLVLCLSGVVSV